MQDTMIEIVKEVELGREAEAWLDAEGNVTIIQDVRYVRLDAEQVTALTALLVGPVVVESVEQSLHTAKRPFCSDETCPCHMDDALFDEYIYQPMMNGLLTTWEANRLRWGESL